MSKEAYSLSILQTRITHPDRAEFAHHEQGVALIIVNTQGQILLGKELHADPAYDRRAGQWNIITETREQGELLKSTILRALAEELGTNLTQFQILPGSYRETNGAYIECMGYSYKYRSAVLRITDDSIHFKSSLDEIAGHKWFLLDELQDIDIEEGAMRLIQEYHAAFPGLFE